MPVAETSQLAECVDALQDAGNFALENPTVEDFIAIERHVDEIESGARETQQAMWAREAKATIRKLEKNEPLTEVDREVIRSFIISDAEHYLAQENNYRDWLGEFRRLVSDLATRAGTLDRESIGAFRGVLKDAARLVSDIRNYLEEQRRVERFDLTHSELDLPSRDMLARILKEQLTSPNR